MRVVAVFPDKIVLKHSTDAAATIIAAIESGGTDEITPGEIVVGREAGAVKLYSVDLNGDIQAVAGGGGGGATQIDDLTDVDTTTTPPSPGDALVWDGSNWAPSAVSSGVQRITDSGTAASGDLTLTGLGESGVLRTVSSSLDAWIVFYGSAAARTSDASRLFDDDPTPGSGVLAEFYIPAGTTVVATPGATYFNNDVSPTSAIYLAVRSQAGGDVDALVTVTAYA